MKKSYEKTFYNIIRKKISYFNNTELIFFRATEKGEFYIVLNKKNEKLRTDIHDILSDRYKNKNIMCLIKKVTINENIKGILYKYELI